MAPGMGGAGGAGGQLDPACFSASRLSERKTPPRVPSRRRSALFCSSAPKSARPVSHTPMLSSRFHGCSHPLSVLQRCYNIVNWVGFHRSRYARAAADDFRSSYTLSCDCQRRSVASLYPPLSLLDPRPEGLGALISRARLICVFACFYAVAEFLCYDFFFLQVSFCTVFLMFITHACGPRRAALRHAAFRLVSIRRPGVQLSPDRPTWVPLVRQPLSTENPGPLARRARCRDSSGFYCALIVKFNDTNAVDSDHERIRVRFPQRAASRSGLKTSSLRFHRDDPAKITRAAQ